MFEVLWAAVQILSALVAPITAGIATLIAYHQYQANKQKFRLDLYERRLEIYKEVKRFILIICREADISFEELSQFRPKVVEADFLFGPDISNYIDELYSRAVSLRQWNGQYQDINKHHSSDYDHANVVEEMHKELDWLVSQLEPAKAKFSEYLRIEPDVLRRIFDIDIRPDLFLLFHEA